MLVFILNMWYNIYRITYGIYMKHNPNQVIPLQVQMLIKIGQNTLKFLISEENDPKNFEDLKKINQYLNLVRKELIHLPEQLRSASLALIRKSASDLNELEQVIETLVIGLNNLANLKNYPGDSITGCNCTLAYKFLHRAHEPNECLFDITLDLICGIRNHLSKLIMRQAKISNDNSSYYADYEDFYEMNYY